MTLHICVLALDKAKQARGCLEAMERVWDSQTPESEGPAGEEEFAYQVKEFMQTCQAAISYFEQEGKCAIWALNFKKIHSDFYARSTGYRSTPVGMQVSKLEGRGDQLPGRALSRQPRDHAHRDWGRRGVRFKKRLYFPNDSGETIIQLCKEHLGAVNEFIQQVYL